MKKVLFFVILLSCICIFAEVRVLGNISEPVILQKSGKLTQFLNQNEIFADAIMLCGDNGTSAYIEYSAFEQVQIDSTQSGWNVKAPLLPAVCQIRNLQEIWIFQSFWKITLTISDDQNSNRYNPFSWNLLKYNNVAESEKNGYRALKYLPAEFNMPVKEGRLVDITYKDNEQKKEKFRQELFLFDGYEFYYDEKPLRKLELE